MRDRSFGVTTLSFTSVMAALFCQLAAVALIMSGSYFASLGSLHGAATLVAGAFFFGAMVSFYALAYGFWAGNAWSWAAGSATFAALIVANVLLSVLAGNIAALLLPSIGAGVAVWYLQRPAIRAELTGKAVPAKAQVQVSDGAAEPAH